MKKFFIQLTISTKIHVRQIFYFLFRQKFTFLPLRFGSFNQRFGHDLLCVRVYAIRVERGSVFVYRSQRQLEPYVGRLLHQPA